MTGHDLSAVRVHKADVHQPGAWPLREPGNEPVHPVLPLRAFLSRLRRRPRFRRLCLRDRVFFGRHEDGMLESEFSGNLVEVCPTGVFTDKTLKRHYTRKWDERTAPSVCVHCALGCNTIPGERYGLLRRIREPFQRRGERLLPLRSRPVWLRVRQQRPAPPIAVRPRRDRPARRPRRIAVERAASCSRLARARSASARRALRSKRTSRCARSSVRTASIQEWPSQKRDCVSADPATSCATVRRARRRCTKSSCRTLSWCSGRT